MLAGRVYPQAKEAFLSLVGPPPCSETAASNGPHPMAAGSTAPIAAVKGTEGGALVAPSCAGPETIGGVGAGSEAQGAGVRGAGGGGDCTCYEGGVVAREGDETASKSAAAAAVQRHDPWEALEALRPPKAIVKAKEPRSTDSSVRSGAHVAGASELDRGRGGGDPGAGADPLGSALLLCETLRFEGRLAEALPPRLAECCGWVLDHTAALFPGWVDAAIGASGTAAGAGRGGSAGGSPVAAATAGGGGSVGGEGVVAAALFDDAAAAIGACVSRRALNGEFEEAQVRKCRVCGTKERKSWYWVCF